MAFTPFGADPLALTAIGAWTLALFAGCETVRVAVGADTVTEAVACEVVPTLLVAVEVRVYVPAVE